MPRRKTKIKPARVIVRAKTNGLDAKAIAYRALLADPCNGPLTTPVVNGPSTGLLVRQKYYVDIASGNSATAQTGVDFVAGLRPSAGQLVVNAISSAGVNRTTVVNLETGILASTICKSYRPVAACMRYVATSAIGDRAGILGMGYLVDRLDNADLSTKPAQTILPLAQKVLSNSGTGEDLEVKWIPSGPHDLEFKIAGGTESEGGNVFIIGRKVDSYAAKVGVEANNSAFANGYLEATVVWEWMPDDTSGIATSVQAGSTSTLTSVLATLGNLGDFAVNNQHVRNMMSAGARTAAMYLAGRMTRSITGPPMLLG